MTLSIHDGRITQLDRIGMSNALFGLAERMATKQTSEAGRAARILGQVAQSVLSSAYPYAKAEAYYAAGDQMIGQVQ